MIVLKKYAVVKGNVICFTTVLLIFNVLWKFEYLTYKLVPWNKILLNELNNNIHIIHYL